jgi:stage V sporulation protein SpoVS
MEERIALMRDDPAVELTVDGNAVGGLLATVFAADVTAIPGQCAHCQTVSLIGTMRAYVRGPGVVLRCPACAEVVLRVVETPTATFLDVSGTRLLRFERRARG